MPHIESSSVASLLRFGAMDAVLSVAAAPRFKVAGIHLARCPWVTLSYGGRHIGVAWVR